MNHKIGGWVKENRSSDCPICGSDSVGVRRLEGGETELRRCDDGHEFEAKAWQWVKPGDATRFD